MGSTVVEQLGDCDGGRYSAVGLCRSEGSQRHKHGGIDSARVVEERADDVLEMAESRGVEGRGCVVELGVLDGSPVGWGNLGMRGRKLRPRRWDVEKFDESAFDVPRHGDVDGAGLIVPKEGEPAVQRACPINGDCVQQL